MKIDQETKKQRKAGIRSPAYPAISLEEAVERAKIIWDKEKKHSAPLSALEKHWGYSVGSGAVSRVVSALGKYGLLDDEGVGEAKTYKLSSAALELILAPDGSQEKAQQIKTAALAPAIFNELFNHYEGELPSDENLTSYLVWKKGFNPGKVNEFIQTFKSTLEFASKFGNLKLINDPGESKEQEGNPNFEQPPFQHSSNIKGKRMLAQYSIPLGPNEASITFTGESLSPADFDALADYVALFKKQYERKLISELEKEVHSIDDNIEN